MWLSQARPTPRCSPASRPPTRTPSSSSCARRRALRARPTAARRSSSRRTTSTTNGSRPPPPACRLAATGGYSLLDKMGVTSSEFQQSVTYKRAIEGELAKHHRRAQGRQDGIRAAGHPGKDRVRLQEDRPDRIRLRRDRGRRRPSRRNRSRRSSTSPPRRSTGMKPADVAVVDSDGKVLSAVGAGPTGGTDTQASDYEQRAGLPSRPCSTGSSAPATRPSSSPPT